VPYTFAVTARRWAYRIGICKSHPADAPVICVGNLTTGGTGKTPTVAWVVRRLREAGHSPAVLTRGYKAVEGTSDEAEMLRQLCQAPVVVEPNRVTGAARAVRGGADVIVMDDGYQHRRLRRDLDIVLVSATDPFGYGWCLPRGLLREPLAALKDAHVVLITHSNEVAAERLQAVRDRIGRHSRGALIALAVHRPTHVLDEQGARQPLETLAGRNVFAFCGLGHPEGFFSSVANLHARVMGRRALDDHADYDADTVGRLQSEMQHCQASLAVTTQKDYVKLADTPLAARTWQLAVDVEISDRREELLDRILSAASRAAGGGT
jgi:tetraacyldisaccharide 4'-kinase